MGVTDNSELVQKNLQPDVLALVVLNVGDGDANIVVFPSKYGKRACALVDSYDADKTIAALERLKPQVILQNPEYTGHPIRFELDTESGKDWTLNPVLTGQ